jgi:hypothetical protein
VNPPPDVYDAEGRPYDDRRHERRRQDDPGEDVLRGWELWAKVMFANRIKTIAVVSALVGAVSWGAATIGMHTVGPAQGIKAVDAKVDTLTMRVIQVEKSVANGAQDRAEIKQSMVWILYLACVNARRTDVPALPPICTTMRVTQ